MTPLVARGGGGGSGGGGGGGGGGGIILLGYLPMHFLGAWLRRLKAKHQIEFDIFQVGGWVLALIYCVLLIIILRGLGAFAAVGAFVGMGAGLYGWFGKLKQNKQTQAALQAAAQQDHTWDPARLQQRAAEVFVQYQADWSSFNTGSMQTYMTPGYHYHASLMMYALQLMGRANHVGNPTVDQLMIVDVLDSPDDSQDLVTIGITAHANDQLIDSATNTQLYLDNGQFTEFWRFRRNGDNWLLDGIQQATASHWKNNPALESFAASQQYYYSLDWGWLLLPKRGQLFGKGKFGTSDINNHVIGVHGQCLVQLYTYSAVPKNSKDSYLIAQTTVPKNYGNIVVRHKKGFHPFGIKGLRNVSTEWPDFNKKYEVYATSAEQATSLELLNPLYMEKLEAVPFEVNIEVVDNVVYLYTSQLNAVDPAGQYQTMLNLLNDAFKEMRL